MKTKKQITVVYLDRDGRVKTRIITNTETIKALMNKEN
jgi:hypothetical protein